MTKIVYNGCYGGFSLSEKAIARYLEIQGKEYWPDEKKNVYLKTHWTIPKDHQDRIRWSELEKLSWENLSPKERKEFSDIYNEYVFQDRDLERDDPILVQVVEELGDEANGMCAELHIEEIPSGTLYRIDEYDGRESVMTNDDYEWKVAR